MSDNTKAINKEDTMITESTKSPSGSTKDSERYQSNKKKSDHYKEKRSKRRSPSSSRSDSEDSDRSRSRPRHSSHRGRDRRTKNRHHRRDSSSSSGSSSPSRSRSFSSSSSSSRSRSNRRRDRKHYRSRKYESSRKYNNHKNRHGHKRRDSRERSERRRGDSTRSRTRSPHPLLRHAAAADTSSIKSLQGNNNANKFWDGFQWVDKTAGNQQEDPVILNQTKKMRRFTISNVPFHLGVDEREIESFVTKFIMENYLHDAKTIQHVREVTIDRSLNTATVELSSVEEASKLAKLDCINILGHSCRISRVGDSKFGPAPTLVNLLTDAQRTAQARAAVIKAMDMLQNKDKGSGFEIKQTDLGAFVAPPQ